MGLYPMTSFLGYWYLANRRELCQLTESATTPVSGYSESLKIWTLEAGSVVGQDRTKTKMDVYDPQTLGIVVFGGFMVVSAIGIALVSTLSMKETSYEEALANQRREQAKAQLPRGDKKKKSSEKKGKAKKREEKPNGKLPEQETHDSGPEPGSETSEPEPESEPEFMPVPEPVPVPVVEALAVPKPVVPEPTAEVDVAMCYVAPTKATAVAAPSAPSPREKKKRKVAKVEPAPAKPLHIVAETITKDLVSTVAKEPVDKESSGKAAKEPGAKIAKEPVTKEPVTKEPGAKVAKEHVAKETSAKIAKEPGAKVAKEPLTKEPGGKVSKEPVVKAVKEQATKVVKEAASKIVKEPSAKEPISKVTKEPVTKSAKEPVAKELATKASKEPVAKESAARAAKEVVAKELSVKASKEPVAKEPATKAVREPIPREVAAKVAKEPVTKESAAKSSKDSVNRVAKEPSVKLVKGQSAKPSKKPVAAEIAPVTVALAKAEDPKPESSSKKKSKKKQEAAVAVDTADVPLLLPFKTLVATLRSSVFNELETQKLLEIISDKAGANTWQLASQKGDPMSALKKQLDEKEKLLSAEQENAAAAKTRLRDLTKELNNEKSKMASVETRLSSELSAREQEMAALHARMKASYEDHTLQTQQLNGKIQSLQEQLENGPNAQLARLQQENTILRDALNQATSLAESRQNAELAKLRQECVRLTREASERADTVCAEEEHRKALESKVSTLEEQVTRAKAGRVEAEQALQQRFEQVKGELRQAEDKSAALQSQLEQCKKEAGKLSELQGKMRLAETEIKARSTEVEDLKAQLAQCITPSRPEEQVSMETGAQTQAETQVDNCEEELRRSLAEREGQVMSLQAEMKKLREDLESVKTAHAEARAKGEGEKQESEAQCTAEVQRLQNSLKEKEDMVASLEQQLEKVKGRMSELQERLSDKDNQAAELKQLREELQQQKTAAEMAEAEQPFESLEKDAHLISLEEELQRLREDMEQAKTKSSELREKNYAAVEALAAAERLSEERLIQAKKAQSDVEQKLHSLQTDTRNALQTLFPHVAMPTEQSNWLEAFIQKAQEPAEERDGTELTEALQKLREAEDGQSALQAQCEQYRSTLSQTEGILKDLQKSVEDGEFTWKSRISEAERQKHAALSQVKTLEETIEVLRVENESTEKLKSQVVLLEAQLEKQLESFSSSQTCVHEVEQLKIHLSTTQTQLESAQSEAQKRHAELLLVKQQLQEATERMQGQEDPQPSEVQAQLEQTEGRLQMEESARLQLEHSYEQALRCVRDLEAQLAELQAGGEGSTIGMKERLKKEGRLTQDLSVAAVTLQRMLRSTQEELAKEREAVRALQDQLQGQEEEELKEGTSV